MSVQAIPIRSRSQAVPMAIYHRQLVVSQLWPRLVVLAAALALYPLVASPWAVPDERSFLTTLPAGATIQTTALEQVPPGTFEPSERPLALSPVARGSALVGGIGAAAITNAEIAISFLDGTVVQPGGQLSFDDTVRTWDFNEDPAYLWSTATSVWGLIPMRGGGVCWVSTALWRAALAGGLRTDFRENHYGLVDTLGAGLDATNTLVIRNDSTLPITVRAWLDDDHVRVALLAEGQLDRAATLSEPERVGRGLYVVSQEVTWADGRTTTSDFLSRYYW